LRPSGSPFWTESSNGDATQAGTEIVRTYSFFGPFVRTNRSGPKNVSSQPQVPW
jgi:hypothetical protein